MNPDTSAIYSKSKDAIWVNQKEMSAAYHWNSPDFNDKITTNDPEKSRYNSQGFEKEIFCKTKFVILCIKIYIPQKIICCRSNLIILSFIDNII